MKIIKAKIEPGDINKWIPPTVMVMYEESNDYEELFTFYPDELSFIADDFIGLTKEEGLHLKFIKDKQYLIEPRRV